jgi:hypothetical protein
MRNAGPVQRDLGHLLAGFTRAPFLSLSSISYDSVVGFFY